MSCQQFSQISPACRTITTIEPDDTLLSVTSSGSTDRSLDESGDFAIPPNTPEIGIPFTVPKASSDYRFEYLYVDDLGIHNPGTMIPMVIQQTRSSFTVDLAGMPIIDGSILRWRVVVHDLNFDISLVDLPENLRVQIIPGERKQTLTFVHPRSDTNYGFTELRVENLDDPPETQRFIVPQVVFKSLTDFTVGFSTPANNANYYLTVRTP